MMSVEKAVAYTDKISDRERRPKIKKSKGRLEISIFSIRLRKDRAWEKRRRGGRHLSDGTRRREKQLL